MSQSLFAQFSQEWEALEKRVCLGFSNRHDIANFLRTWTVRAGESPDERAVLLVQIQLASQTLGKEADKYEALIRNAREKAAEQTRLEAERKARDDAARAEQARRKNERWEERQREAKAKLERTNAETQEIWRQIAAGNAKAADDRNRLLGPMTNPENYCPVCNTAYVDSTSGCWHCTARRYPYR